MKLARLLSSPNTAKLPRLANDLRSGGMRLLLIRHGETVHNVAGVYAGVTDSALTNHGVLQANRLGSYLASKGFNISHIFSSDLQRAYLTAEAIREPQFPKPPSTTKLELLREQDFGYYECKKFLERSKESKKNGKDTHQDGHREKLAVKDVESKQSMRARMEAFIDGHLIQLLREVEDAHTIAIVAHGIILSHLWRTLLKRFHPRSVSVMPSVQLASTGFNLEQLTMWSNTGYLDLEVRRTLISTVADSILAGANSAATSDYFITAPEPFSSPQISTTLTPKTPVTTARSSSISPSSTTGFPTMSLVVKAVNSQEHLKGLKKTRGGIGSLKHDTSQKTMDSFFKKRKLG